MKHSLSYIISKRKNYIFLFLSLLGGFITYLSLRFGIGISPDSTFYISAAESLKSSGELRDIWKGAYWDYMTHYPPGYSIAIAVSNCLSTDVFTSVKCLNILLFSGFIFILGFYLKKHLSLVSTIFLLVFVIFSLSFINIYEMAWSECLFLPLSFLGLFTFNNYLTTNKIKWLLISSVLISLSVFTRYIGITLIITITLFLFFSKEKWVKKLFHITVFNLIANGLIFYWFLRNMFLTNDAASREFSYHSMTKGYYVDLFKSIKQLFFQFRTTSFTEVIIGAILFFVIIVYFITLIRRDKTSVNRFKLLLVSYFIVNLFFLFISNTFFDLTPLYYRIITPALFGVLISFLIEFDQNFKSKIKLTLLGVLLFIHTVTALSILINKIDGRDFNNSTYKNVSTNTFINNLDFNNNLVFTNEVDRVYYLTHKVGYWILNFNDFKFNTKKKVLINYKNGRRFEASQEIILSQPHILIKETEDALIYGI